MNDNLCNKCGKCCQNIKVDFKNNRLYFDGIQFLNDNFKDMLIEFEIHEDYSLCKCKYLYNNICTNENKPDICKNYPSSPFAFITEDCGYQGLIFLYYEQVKQKIRKLKEEIIHYEALIKISSNKKEIQQYQKIIYSHQKIIDKYKEYGSNDW